MADKYLVTINGTIEHTMKIAGTDVKARGPLCVSIRDVDGDSPISKLADEFNKMVSDLAATGTTFIDGPVISSIKKSIPASTPPKP